MRRDDLPASEQPTFLITGATGFLGRHVLEALRRQVPHARLLVLVRDARSWKAQPWREILGNVEVLVGGLLSTAPWRADPRLGDLRGIFHLAAEVKHTRSEIDDMMRVNVEGTSSMVRLAAERRCRLLFVSTSGTVSCSTRPGRGVYEDAPFCEDVVDRWPYYASKIRAEREASRLSRELGVDLVIFRPPVLLGPGDHRFRSTAHVLRVLRRKLPFIVDGGMHFVDVRDAADAMVRAMGHAHPQPIYHLSGTACTLREFFRMVAEQAGLKPSWTVVPRRLVWYTAKLNEISGLRLHIIPDPVVIEMAAHHWEILSRHAEADLGYRSRPPERTIAETVSWLRLNHPDLQGASLDE
ncbi:MAG: NAD-dependent epimerase/dehydratase family protein [Gemmatimonadota bacterium]|nr:NAD-dependent epimerase/dehydratase family protein [Gemmatimonadota bacterium]